jgi:hypothetical protein
MSIIGGLVAISHDVSFVTADLHHEVPGTSGVDPLIA